MFYLWWIRLVLKCSKMLWPGLSENFLFALYTSNDDSNVWKKCSFGSKKNLFFQNTTHWQSWKLSIVKFWPKPNMKNSAYTNQFEILTQLNCFVFLLKIREMLWSYGKCQKIEAWQRLGPVMTKNCLFRQSRTKNLEQNREIQWNWTGQESLDIYLCMFFNCHYQSFIFRTVRLGTRLSPP